MRSHPHDLHVGPTFRHNAEHGCQTRKTYMRPCSFSRFFFLPLQGRFVSRSTFSRLRAEPSFATEFVDSLLTSVISLLAAHGRFLLQFADLDTVFRRPRCEYPL